MHDAIKKLIPKAINLDAAEKKVIIFSDTHLSKKFEPKKFNFLRKIIKKADQVVINGDFWDYGHNIFHDFVNSKWSELFPLLKEKNTIYLYGNHDPIELSDERVSLFSVKQGDMCQLKVGDKELLVRHGHKLAPTFDLAWPRVFSRRKVIRLINLINQIGIFLAGKYYLRSYQAYGNRRTKTFSADLADNQFLVCGHTHALHEGADHQFINIGVVNWSLAQYLLLEEGKIKLMDERY